MKNRLNIIVAVGEYNEKKFACASLIINNIEVDKVVYVSQIKDIYNLSLTCINKILKTCKGKEVYLYQHSNLLNKQKNEDYRNHLFTIQKGFIGKLNVLVSAPKCEALASQIKLNIDDYPLEQAYFPEKIDIRRSYPLYSTPQQKQILKMKTELLKIFDELVIEQIENLLNYARDMAAPNALNSGLTTAKQNRG